MPASGRASSSIRLLDQLEGATIDSRHADVLRGTAAGPHQLRCDWTLTMLLWIQASNLVAIVLSLGLLIPWATVRMQAYKLPLLTVAVHGDLAAVAAAEAEEVSALGDEIGETFDYDFGL